MTTLVMVAAVARNGAIGRDNRLLWRLKSDLQRFKRITLGKPMIMGRKTYDSIGRPLPGRTTIVVTRDPAFAAAGVMVAASPEAALHLARQEAEKLGVPDVIIAGGGEIYTRFLPIADRLEITEVDLAPVADAYFPPLDPTLWKVAAREAHAPGPGDETAFTFVTYVRADA
ncbi:MAG TPA: dihydrofolate reductase [Beijerinckiaceae bacterium]|nr:dihydrofolate reductase [Beijerinckiaceae bacterium]